MVVIVEGERQFWSEVDYIIVIHFHTDKLSLESMFHWLSGDTVKFEVDVRVCVKFAKM